MVQDKSEVIQYSTSSPGFFEFSEISVVTSGEVLRPDCDLVTSSEVCEVRGKIIRVMWDCSYLLGELYFRRHMC